MNPVAFSTLACPTWSIIVSESSLESAKQKNDSPAASDNFIYWI